MEAKVRRKAEKYLARLSEPRKSAVVDAIELASEEEIAMIEEGMREYEGDPSSFKDWKTIKKEQGLA